MTRVNVHRKSVCILLVAFILALAIPSLMFAQEEKKDTRPERGMAVYPEYSGVIVPKGEAVKMDLILDNKGRTDETIDVAISQVPKGWKASLKGGGYQVMGLFVPNGKTRNLCNYWTYRKVTLRDLRRR